MSDLINYEISFLLSPLIPTEKVEAELASIVGALVTAAGGKLASDLFPTRLLTLAYPVSRRQGQARQTFTSAYFGSARFTAAPSAIPDLESRWRDQETILRFLLIAVPTIAPAKNRVKPPRQTVPAPTEDFDKKLDRVLDYVSQ